MSAFFITFVLIILLGDINITFMIQQLAFLLPCLVCLFWAVTLSIGWKKNLRVQNIWTIALLLAMINAFYWTCMDACDFELYTYLGMLLSFTHIGFYSLLYLFYRSLVDCRPFTWKHYLIFIPGLLYGIINDTLMLMIGTKDLAAFMATLIANNWAMPADMGPLLTIHHALGSYIGFMIGVCVINFVLISMIVKLINHKEGQADFFILAKKQSEKRSRAVFGGLLALLIIMFIYVLGEFLYFIEDYIPLPILFALQGGLFFYISYHVYYLNKS